MLEEMGFLDFDPKRLTGPMRVALVTWFFNSFCRHLKGPLAGQTLQFEDWEREKILEPIFGTVDRYGRRKHTTALVGLPRKHKKSLNAAGFALYGGFIEAIWEPGAEVYMIASKKDQARKVFEPAKFMVERDPFLSAYAKVYKDAIYVPELGSEIRVLASDAPGEHGSNPSMYIIDELHAFKNMDMFEAMSSGTVIRREPLGIIITTAGVKRSGPLWDLLHQPKGKREYRVWIGASESADATDPEVWRAANPASWVTTRFLRDQFEDPKLSPAAFEAYHLNRFPLAKGVGRFFSPSEIDRTSRAPVIDPAKPAYMTVDGADKSDHFAITLTQKDDEGVINALSWIWEDPPADLGYYALSVIEETAVEIHDTYNVHRVAIDGNRIRMLAIRLQDHYGLPIEEFSQSDNKLMCSAAAALRTVIREDRMNAGSNGALRAHLANAIELDRQPVGTRIGKASDDEKIDGAITLAMGVFLWETTDAPKRSFAETGGFFSVSLG
jgi:phage terminase large subunit-like protein